MNFTQQRSCAYDALVLDARFRQSLVAVRSLGSRGLRIAIADTEHNIPAFSSRWGQYRLLAPSSVGSAQPDFESLMQLLRHSAAHVLIPTADWTIDLIRRHRAQLEQHTDVALAREPALRIAINKMQTLEIARGLGCHVPRSVSVRSASEIQAAVDEIGLPLVVKPVESWVQGQQQGERITSRLVAHVDEARHAVDELTRSGNPVLFQQYLTGRREAVSLLSKNGTIYARFAQWAKRTEPPLGGTSVFRQSIRVPADIGSQAERLVRELDLDGYSEVEFRRDSIGTPYLMEINPRLSASVEVAVRAGVDFPYLLYQWASGGLIDVVKNYRPGVWMRYLGGDIRTTADMVIRRGQPGVPGAYTALRDFCISFFMPAHYDYVDWRDPLPAYRAVAGFVRYALTSGAMTKTVRSLLKRP